MKPLNEKERNKMFYGFLAFSVLALLLVVVPILFSINIKKQTDSRYKKKFNDSRKAGAEFKQYVDEIIKIDSSLNKYKDSKSMNLYQNISNQNAALKLKVENSAGLSPELKGVLRTSCMIIDNSLEYIGKTDTNLTNKEKAIEDLTKSLKEKEEKIKEYLSGIK